LALIGFDLDLHPLWQVNFGFELGLFGFVFATLEAAIFLRIYLLYKQISSFSVFRKLALFGIFYVQND